MTGTSAGERRPRGSGGGEPRSQPGESRDLWPRDFGRDGVSGLVSVDRAMRARDVSRPRPADVRNAEQVVAELLSRLEGRRR
jgi:hypothetical protein